MPLIKYGHCDFGENKVQEAQKKWPKLKELHIKLFGSSFANAHSALIDAKITAKCFLELKRRKIIDNCTSKGLWEKTVT